ncbi:hypothetical protein NPIL_322751 [Nephila pilipes]|uniref:Uncharacterized protein n=1 Tax=Nephila pilipes TaxID=299642 RepID=A0A8X6UTH1_NEPPI|nr:hypothetical protein NPIL_322751 [Nephila pilipes]
MVIDSKTGSILSCQSIYCAYATDDSMNCFLRAKERKNYISSTKHDFQRSYVMRSKTSLFNRIKTGNIKPYMN